MLLLLLLLQIILCVSKSHVPILIFSKAPTSQPASQSAGQPAGQAASQSAFGGPAGGTRRVEVHRPAKVREQSSRQQQRE